MMGGQRLKKLQRLVFDPWVSTYQGHGGKYLEKSFAVSALLPSEIIISEIKLRRLRREIYLAHIENNAYIILARTPEGTDRLGGPSVDGRILLKCILDK
jgi:hypothetical protein